MKKGLIIIYLSLLISSCNSEERKAVSTKVINKVENKNINWVKLTDNHWRNDEIIEQVKKGIGYIEINGKKLVCGEIRDGKKEGKWIEYDYDGKKDEEGNYVNGRAEGKWIEWYKNGNMKAESIYKDGGLVDKVEYDEKTKRKKDGKAKEKDEDGIILEGSYVNGRKEGHWIYWYDDNRKHVEGNYMNGRAEGKWIGYYYDNGQKRAEITYKDNIVMEWIYWNKDGERVKLLTITDTGENIIRLTDDDLVNLDAIEITMNGRVYQAVKGKEYKCGEILNGKREGKWIEWYENGQKKEEGNLVKGKPEGKWIYWYENGQKKSEENYKNGKMDGKWIEWYENGNKKEELTYKNAEKVEEIGYDKNGKKELEITYKNGEEMSWVYWKDNGEKVNLLTTTSTGEKIIKLEEDTRIHITPAIDSDGTVIKIVDCTNIQKIIDNAEKAIVYSEVDGKYRKLGNTKKGKLEGYWIYYYDDDKKREEGNYKDGKKEGKWIYWYENGKKEGEITYKDDKEVEVIYWKKNGERVEILRTTSTGERIIKIVDNNLIGLISLIVETEKGIAYQEIKGKDYKCGEIMNGKREGKWIYWYENGKKEGEITYKDDKEVEVIYWKKNGERVEILRTTSTGERIIKIVDNNLIGLVSLINGTEKGGVYQEVKGEIYKCGDIKNGDIEGKWIEWYENGNKKEEGRYKDGKKEGKYIWWYENGKKELEAIFKDDEEIKRIEYDKNGNRIKK